MKSNLFRKDAIEHLSNPDDLHSAIQLTRSFEWLGLFVLVSLTLFLLVWSILTKVPITVAGQGIILDSTGVLEKIVTVGTTGRITQLNVAIGDRVEKGQAIAILDQREARDELKALTEKLADLNLQLEKLHSLNERERQTFEKFEAQQKVELEEYITSLQQRLKVLNNMEQGTRAMKDKQLASNKDLLDIVVQISETENNLARSKSQLKNLLLDRELKFNAKEKEILKVNYEINNTKREIVLLELSISSKSIVKSPYPGVVSEIKLDKGELAEPGAGLISLVAEDISEFSEDELQAVVYAPPEEGKKVKVGMPVNIYPSIYKREEYGGIIGEVIKVKNVTATAEGILRVTKNEQLVEMLTEKGAPFEVWVRLKKSATHSGVEWNASEGPNNLIEAGTLCIGETLVREVSLITLVLPALEPYLNQDYETRTAHRSHNPFPFISQSQTEQ